MSENKFFYTVYGLTLKSDYEFPQFSACDRIPQETDIEIEYGGIPDEIYSIISEGYYKQIKNDELWFYNQVGLFYIHDKRKINYVEYNEGTIDDAAVFIPGMCLAILLWHRGMIPIHGSCIRYKDKTVIISGGSGAGKSTITNRLMDRGALLMADDVTGIGVKDGTFISYPAFPAQKLCVDRIEKENIDTTGLKQIRYDKNKFEVPVTDNFHDKCEVADAFFSVGLGDVERLETGKVEGADKVKIISDSIFIHWLLDSDYMFGPQEMMRCISLANQLDIYRITRNEKENTLEEILDYIESCL